MSWIPFRQGTSADVSASESSIDGSTLVDCIRESNEHAAYDRLQPEIERDSPVFLAKVAEFQALLDCPDQTLLNIFETCGFTPIERQLLISVPSSQVDLELYNLQSTNRRQYRLKLLQRGVHQDELPAVQLALCWFGAPFASLALDVDGDITTLNDATLSNSLSQFGYRSDEDNGDSLAFLDEYDECTHDLASPSQPVRLRGGAAFTADIALSQTSVAESTSAPTKSKTVRLHGFQGAVNFDVYDRQTFSDAVARLMGPVQTVIFAIYKVAPKSGKNGKPQSTQPPEIYIAGKSYEYWHMRKIFCEDGAEGDNAIFVCGLGEEPPLSQWLPFDCDPRYAETVVYCSRSADSSSNYSDLHDEDEAYLRMPLNVEKLSPNQYFEWMFVVARILTPGAGLDALTLGEAGVVPRCLFSLHRDCSDGKTALFDPKTPGGVAFSPRAWSTLVSDVIEMWSKNQIGRAEFDVVPTTYDESRHLCSVHVSLFGATFETESVNAAAFLTQPPPDDEFNVRQGAPFRKELSDKVHKYLKDALTPEEHDQLDCINLWANGRFWTGKPIVVTLDDFGSDLKGFNDRWVVQSIQAYMHVIPSAFFVRPVFKAYEAIAKDGGTEVSISFGSEVTLEQFRALLAMAEIPGLNPDIDHFVIRQTADCHNMYPEVHPNLTETQRKQSNRPSFFISPDTDEDEWALVRSQIVSPTVWLDFSDISAAVLQNPVDSAIFGFCSGYGNMLDTKERFISDQSHDIPTEVSGQGVVYDNADVNHVADVEMEDAEGVEVEDVQMKDVEEHESALAGVLEGILQHATEIEKEAPITTIGEATTRNGGRSSMVLLPLSGKDVEEEEEEEEVELGPDDVEDFQYPFMDTILLRISIPCPYSDSGCELVFGGDEPEGRCTVGDFIRHCEGHFGLEGEIQLQQPTLSGVEMACAACATLFGADATDTEKLLHLVDVHGLMYAVDKDNIAEVVEQEAPEEVIQQQVPATPPAQEQEPEASEQEKHAQSGLASPPESASNPKSQNKRKRRSTPARQADPSFQPDSDAEDTGNQSSGSHSSNMTPARRAGRAAAKRRRMAEKDSVYRPEEGAGDSEEDDLANDVVPDSLESPAIKSTKTAAKKRKQVADPSYHPSTDINFILGVVDELLGKGPDDGVSGPKSKKKKMGAEDPSFRPSEPKTQLYVDDQDDELRRSAVPEWEQDPTDPAGKRKRVIREKGAAVAAVVSKPSPTKTTPVKPAVTKPAKPARASRAATPARSRAATPARSRAATPARSMAGTPARSKAATPAKSKVALLATSTDSLPEEASEGRRRSGRSRQPPQKLGQ